ncbi:MAG: GDP-L-fucose synthase [Humidesulfovibrio sp.]|uniref:GDP-L-fucose synthase family protein n=1 Tax=Humidesulfovibrio sp. TaxID=2910988 RepID=UPI0027E8857B|nr:GDP-L-fucose synthase [Humidesulfovibrio sp.]MDQ7834357.1 GDP-L-fucose synthase [Humidesulfovibrio sp.]
MRKDSRIYVAGHRGLAGSALARALAAAGYANVLTRTHAELDLTDQAAVRAFFQAERPDHVFLAAARVGGIHANSTYPAQFIRDNLAIQTNVIHEAWAAGVDRLLFLGSSCIYPRHCPQPMREEHLLTGPLEPTNRAYAVAKIAGIEMCASYNRQYGTRFLAAMPTNLYGPGDTYDLENSHVIPAIIRKMHEAKARGDAEVVIWGTGDARREFLFSDDMAGACVMLMGLPQETFGALLGQGGLPLINVGSGEEMSVSDMARVVAEVVGFRGGFAYDSSRPDGTPKKVLDASRIFALGWRPRVALREGIAAAYQDFLSRYGA